MRCVAYGEVATSGTGANSLGSLDFNAALAQLNAAYFGPKTAWIMNQVTLSTLSCQLTKYDQILVQECVHLEQVNVLTDDLCCAKKCRSV